MMPASISRQFFLGIQCLPECFKRFGLVFAIWFLNIPMFFLNYASTKYFVNTSTKIIFMRKLFPLYLVALVVCNCNNNKTASAVSSEKDSSEASSPAGQNIIVFKVNGDEVKTSGWNIRRFTWSSQSAVWMNITSDMHKDKRAINVNLNGAKPGTYSFDDKGVIMEKSHGSYHPDYNDPSNSYSIVGGSFIITDVDTVHHIVNGTFSLTAKNPKGETLNITDGKIIKGTLKPGVISL